MGIPGDGLEVPAPLGGELPDEDSALRQALLTSERALLADDEAAQMREQGGLITNDVQAAAARLKDA